MANEEYSEDLVFELIDKINKEKIAEMVNEETQELNPNGRVELKNIIDSYQKKNDEEENDENNKDKKKDNMDNSIKREDNKFKKNISVSQSQDHTEETEDLQTKNEIFLLTDNSRKWDIRNFKIWRNYKLWIYMFVIILIILIIVIII